VIKSTRLDQLRRMAQEGGQYCFKDGCEVGGRMKDFKKCPQCKDARYCAMRVRSMS